MIGFVGSDDKVEYCKKELNFDHVFNYKKTNFSTALSEVAPDGVDIYYDNVSSSCFFFLAQSKHISRLLIKTGRWRMVFDNYQQSHENEWTSACMRFDRHLQQQGNSSK